MLQIVDSKYERLSLDVLKSHWYQAIQSADSLAELDILEDILHLYCERHKKFYANIQGYFGSEVCSYNNITEQQDRLNGYHQRWVELTIMNLFETEVDDNVYIKCVGNLLNSFADDLNTARTMTIH